MHKIAPCLWFNDEAEERYTESELKFLKSNHKYNATYLKIHQLLQAKDYNKLKIMLEDQQFKNSFFSGFNYSHYSYNSVPFLNILIDKHPPEVLENFLQFKPNLEVSDGEALSPLILAIKKNDLHKTKLLLDAGARADYWPHYSFSVIFFGLEQLVDPPPFDYYYEMRNPLNHAKTDSMVLALLESGAKGSQGTPLLLHGKALGRYLLERNHKLSNKHLNIRWSALHSISISNEFYWLRLHLAEMSSPGIIPKLKNFLSKSSAKSCPSAEIESDIDATRALKDLHIPLSTTQSPQNLYQEVLKFVQLIEPHTTSIGETLKNYRTLIQDPRWKNLNEFVKNSMGLQL